MKNAPGPGVKATRDTARADLYALHVRHLRHAGVLLVSETSSGSGSGDGVVSERDGGPGPAEIEIDACVSYAGEGLGSLAGRALEWPVRVTAASVGR